MAVPPAISHPSARAAIGPSWVPVIAIDDVEAGMELTGVKALNARRRFTDGHEILLSRSRVR